MQRSSAYKRLLIRYYGEFSFEYDVQDTIYLPNRVYRDPCMTGSIKSALLPAGGEPCFILQDFENVAPIDIADQTSDINGLHGRSMSSTTLIFGV